MTAFIGQIYDVFDFIERGNFFYIPNKDQTLSTLEYGEVLQGQATSNFFDKESANKVAQVYDPYEDSMMNTVYLFPADVDAGFILEDKASAIKLWNAYRTEKTLNSILATSPLGTNLNLIAPQDIVGLNVIEHVLDIYKAGPPVQNSKYLYDISSEEVELSVVGKRIEVWEFENNWKNGIEIILQFSTVVWANELYYEQRRSLRENYFIKQIASFLFNDLEMQKFFNNIKELQSKLMAIPFYNSACLVQNDLIGNNSLDVLENIDDHKFFQRSLFVCIFDIKKEIDVEIKEVDYFTTNSIVLLSNVLGDFKSKETAVYPVFFGRIESSPLISNTGNIISSTISFREMDI